MKLEIQDDLCEPSINLSILINMLILKLKFENLYSVIYNQEPKKI